jgi:hypothetical protein
VGVMGLELMERNPQNKPTGKVACWVDDNVGGAVELSGNADVGEPTLTYVSVEIRNTS